jgi:hypothetical protein
MAIAYYSTPKLMRAKVFRSLFVVRRNLASPQTPKQCNLPLIFAPIAFAVAQDDLD